MNIPSVEARIQIEGTRLRSPTSESLFQTIGGSVNYALDQVDALNASDVTQNAAITALQNGQLTVASGSYSAPGGTFNFTTGFTNLYFATIIFTGSFAGDFISSFSNGGASNSALAGSGGAFQMGIVAPNKIQTVGISGLVLWFGIGH